MLHLSWAQWRNLQVFVVQSCQAKSLPRQTKSFRNHPNVVTYHGRTEARRYLHIRYTNDSTPSELAFRPRLDLSQLEDDRTKSKFREELRQWEVANEGLDSITHTDIQPSLAPQDVVNLFGTSGKSSEFQIAPVSDIADYEGGNNVARDGDDVVRVGVDRSFLIPGDMVALKSIGGDQEMAIFIRDIEKQSQFYAMSGRYVHTQSRASDFLVPGFVDREELREIETILPTSLIPRTLEDKLQSMTKNVPKHIGRPLLEKMLRFRKEAMSTFHEASSRLDNAHNILAHHNRFRYGTLMEFAEELLSSSTGKNPDGTLPASALFAVHQALTRDDSGFRVESHGSMRTTIHYEVSSIRELQNNLLIAQEIRKYRQDILKQTQSSSLHKFVCKARELIDQSRTGRDATARGVVGPYSGEAQDPEFRTGIQQDLFETKEEAFLLFMESWTALATLSQYSSLNGIGSTILRAVNRYPDENLDRSTGWKFLQEVGYIPPWQTMAPYNLRLPSTGRRLRSEQSKGTTGYVTDKLSKIRKDWEQLPVFCIDDVTALEIDDGVSLERAERHGEYWVRIHIADPAAHIEPRSDIAASAESHIGNTYFQDRVSFMLDPKFVAKNLSLAKGRPCLTFSAKMNFGGEILEVDVKPGIVRRIVYMIPALFAKVGEGSSIVSESTNSVGQLQDVGGPTPRPMSGEIDLSADHIQALKTLHLLARARDEKLKQNGGLMFQTPAANISVSFGGADWERLDQPHASRRYQGDPSIIVKTPSEADSLFSARPMSAVARLMLIANEVAARWCHERGIPIPYRKTQTNPEDNPLEYFKEKILPIIKDGGRPGEDEVRQYFALVGRAQLSTSAGPHQALGVDMIAKATSPLRRYPDLLLHWQIGAALLEKAETGRSLVGNTSDDFLPFSRSEIDSKLSRIEMKERSISAAHRQSSRAWLCQYLVRAWKYGEGTLPSPLRFKVARWGRQTGSNISKSEKGTLLDFTCTAEMGIPEGIEKDDIQHGDEFEVEFANVDPYALTIELRGIRRWSSPNITE